MGQGLGGCQVDGFLSRAAETTISADGLAEAPSAASTSRGSQLLCEGVCRGFPQGVVCTSVGKDVYIYDSATGKKVNVLADLKGLVTCLLCRGNALFTGSVDRSVRRWDLDSGQELLQLCGHDGPIWCLALAKGTLFSASEDSSIIGWNPTSGERLARLMQHTLPVRCLLDMGDALLSGADDGSLVCWDLESFGALASTQAHSSAITCMLRLDDGTVFTGCADGGISRWTQHCRASMGTLEGHSEWVTCLLDYEAWLFSGSRDCTVRRWDLQTGALSLRLDLGTCSFRHLPAGSILISELGQVTLGKGEQEDKLLLVPVDFEVMAFAGMNGRYLSVPLQGGRATAAAESRGPCETFRVQSNGDGSVSLQAGHGMWLSVAEAKDRPELVGVSLGGPGADGRAPVTVKEKFTMCRLDPHYSGVTCLAVVNGVLMTGAADRTVKLWCPSAGVQYANVELRSGVTCLMAAAGGLYASLARGQLMKLPKPPRNPTLKHKRPRYSLADDGFGECGAAALGSGLALGEAASDREELRLDEPPASPTAPSPPSQRSPRSPRSPLQLPMVAPPMAPSPLALPRPGEAGGPPRVALRPPPASGSSKVIHASRRAAPPL